MSLIRNGYLTAAVIGWLWTFVMAIVIAVLMSFSTGEAFRPSFWYTLVFGTVLGLVTLYYRDRRVLSAALAVATLLTALAGIGPIRVGEDVGFVTTLLTALFLGVFTAWPLTIILESLVPGVVDKHEFEGAVIRFLTGFGYIFFTSIVLVPFYVMVMTSLKNQQALLQNPLDFTIDLSRGWDLFRSYFELFGEFGFGAYMWTSFYVSVITVFITLIFSIPGAYAVARLRFKGRKAFGRSILLIYMVPMIVLALPIYIVFSIAGLRNTILGIVLIYPV
ncbi:MAG: carbohydrate ABC transporter permease, partial [Pseudomonadota bacterium]